MPQQCKRRGSSITPWVKWGTQFADTHKIYGVYGTGIGKTQSVSAIVAKNIKTGRVMRVSTWSSPGETRHLCTPSPQIIGKRVKIVKPSAQRLARLGVKVAQKSIIGGAQKRRAYGSDWNYGYDAEVEYLKKKAQKRRPHGSDWNYGYDAEVEYLKKKHGYA